MSAESDRAVRALDLAEWFLDQLDRDDVPEHNAGDLLCACLVNLLGMAPHWERHSGETLELLGDRAELALMIAMTRDSAALEAS